MTDVEAIEQVEQLLQRGRLTTVQEIVFSESWAGQTYLDMAVNSGYDPGYIKDVGSELWRSISQAVGEKVTKTNLRAVLYRATQRQPEKIAASTLNLPPVKNYSNLGAAMLLHRGCANDVSQFYGRTAELATLSRWILSERCRVVAILGIGGIGKTALSVKLAEQLQGEFEYVIWRSLRNAPSLPDLLTEILAVVSRQQEIKIAPTTHISRLIHYLQQHRCLLILDNVESILLGKRPRQYLAGYEFYGELFRQLAECSHQSCILLTSCEQISEISMFAGANLPIRILPLRGLSIAESMSILEDKGLPLTIDKGQQLIDLYAGNPLALKIIATSILELFDGRISEFFEQGAAVFNGIRILLDRQFDRLSPIEAQIMYSLAILVTRGYFSSRGSALAEPLPAENDSAQYKYANDREWVSIGELQADLIPAISTAQLLESLEYLQGRSLIEQHSGKFTQQPVVIEYAIDKLTLSPQIPTISPLENCAKIV